MSELVNIKTNDGSGTPLRIIDWIAVHSYIKCNYFAHILLKDKDGVIVARLRKYNKKDDAFVYAVLREWLSIPDDSASKAAPRTWKALAECVGEAGLEGTLAKAIRENCPQGVLQEA